MGVLLIFPLLLLLLLHFISATDTLTPITDRDKVNKNAIPRPKDTSNLPQVFKCRTMAHGKSFSFAHEWVHFSAKTHCSLILLNGRFTEQVWSDIVHQAYRIENYVEHIPYQNKDGTYQVYKTNHKFPILRVLFQRYLAPQVKQLKHTNKWEQVKKQLKQVGCPLFQDVDLPDVLHPNWWSDVGFTANRMFGDADNNFNSPPTGTIVGDLTTKTLFAVAEGVISWDEYRWYKDEVSCTPLVEVDVPQDQVKYVKAIDAKRSIEILWLDWCGAAAENDKDLGACNGKKWHEDGRNIHPGMVYNAVGGGLTLGTKSEIELSTFSWLQRMTARFIRGVGEWRQEQEKKQEEYHEALSHSDDVKTESFEKNGVIARCKWNVEHQEREKDFNHLMEENQLVDEEKVPFQFKKEHQCDQTKPFRRRIYNDFPKIDSEEASKLKQTASKIDPPPSSKLQGNEPGRKSSFSDHIQNYIVTPIKNAGTSVVNLFRKDVKDVVHNTWENVPEWWHENPYAKKNDDNNNNKMSSYSSIRNLNKPVDAQTTVGVPPFGWNRQTCMLCWSLPIYLSNLVQECTKFQGRDNVNVLYASDLISTDSIENKDSLEKWVTHSKSNNQKVYVCGGENWTIIRKNKKRKDKFFHIQLWLLHDVATEDGEETVQLPTNQCAAEPEDSLDDDNRRGKKSLEIDEASETPETWK